MRTPLMAASAALLATLAAAGSVLAQETGGETRHEDEATEVEDIIVQSTRSRRRVQDEPVRVEVLGQEEIEEKLLSDPATSPCCWPRRAASAFR